MEDQRKRSYIIAKKGRRTTKKVQCVQRKRRTRSAASIPSATHTPFTRDSSRSPLIRDIRALESPSQPVSLENPPTKMAYYWCYCCYFRIDLFIQHHPPNLLRHSQMIEHTGPSTSLLIRPLQLKLVQNQWMILPLSKP